MQKELEHIFNSFSFDNNLYDNVDYQDIIYINSVILENNLDLLFLNLTNNNSKIKYFKKELEVEIDNIDDISYYKFLSGKKKIIKNINKNLNESNIEILIQPVLIVEFKMEEIFHQFYFIFDKKNKKIYKCGKEISKAFDNILSKFLNNFLPNFTIDNTIEYNMNGIYNVLTKIYEIDYNSNLDINNFSYECFNLIFDKLWYTFLDRVSYHRLITDSKSSNIQIRKLNNLLKLNNKNLINLSIDGLTCLHLSCQKGLYNFSKILIDNGADINILSEYGSNSPLHVALKFNNDLNSEYHKIMRYLIQNNIEINSYDEDDATPLFIAAAKNDFEIFNLLLNKGANINTKTSSNKNIIHYMISSPEYFKISKNNDKILKLIIDKGIKIDDLDINNRNSLHSACNYLSSDYVEWIIDISNKLNINLSNEKDIDGLTPLDLAKISKIDNHQINNYLLNLNNLIKLNFADLNYSDNKKNAELKILNYFLRNQHQIINIFND